MKIIWDAEMAERELLAARLGVEADNDRAIAEAIAAWVVEPPDRDEFPLDDSDNDLAQARRGAIRRKADGPFRSSTPPPQPRRPRPGTVTVGGVQRPLRRSR